MLGLVSYASMLAITFQSVAVSTNASFSWDGNGLLIGDTKNATVYMYSSNVTSKLTIVTARTAQGILVGYFVSNSVSGVYQQNTCELRMNNTNVNVNLVNGTSSAAMFGEIVANSTLLAYIYNLNINVTIKCLWNITGVLSKKLWTNVDCT